MPVRQTTCFTCPVYDRAANRCRVGKSNPRRKLDSVTVAETLGPQALCLHNPHREALILRMRFPARRYVWPEPAARPAVPLEVEILD